MTIGISGGINYTDKEHIYEVLDKFFLMPHYKMAVGDAKGTDSIAVEYAKEKGFKYKVYEANWKAYKGGAGSIRNAEIVAQSNILVAFWNGTSTGTGNCIDQAREKGLDVYVQNVYYPDRKKK